MGIALIMTTRAVVAYGVVLYVSAYLVGLVARNTDRKIRLGSLLLSEVIISLLICAYVTLGQMYRWGKFDSGLDASNGSKAARIALTGHMSVLGNWIKCNGFDSPVALGRYTFAGLARYLVGAERKNGLYDTSVMVTSEYETNIYTAFRPAIDDFGLLGGLVFFAAISAAASFGRAALASGRFWGSAPLLFFFAYVLWSPITSIYIYNAIIGAVFLFGVLTVSLTGEVVANPGPPAKGSSHAIALQKKDTTYCRPL